MRRLWLSLLVAFGSSAVAYASGFQVTAQGARAMGMGLAYTAVANDASAIFYNPAGLGTFDTDLVLGGMGAGNREGSFTATGTSNAEEQDVSVNFLPQLYGATKVGPLHLGVGVYTPFGLPMRWENPATFSGRRTSYLASIRTLTINPTAAVDIGSLSIGAGADWMHSRVQLERFNAAPVAPGVSLDVARSKLVSDLQDSDGWGWNAGVLWRGKYVRLGASYRSQIDIDHDATLTLTQVPTGIPALDANVHATLPSAPLDAAVPMTMPSSLNLGASFMLGRATIALEADRTDWSQFDRIVVQTPVPAFGISRVTGWEDTWAHRIGAELPCGPVICRAGYYRDETPQPLSDVGPVLPDADRQAFTVGLGFGSPNFGVDIGYVYVRFDDRTTTAAGTDFLAGTWKSTGNELAVNLHWQH
ncbi:MAG TPA: outer membrane protein transport protein [Thermoanaerobaculia bacterium]|jgi:long-chain fatty acid transport protein